jgi:hypothetical protein
MEGWVGVLLVALVIAVSRTIVEITDEQRATGRPDASAPTPAAAAVESELAAFCGRVAVERTDAGGVEETWLALQVRGDSRAAPLALAEAAPPEGWSTLVRIPARALAVDASGKRRLCFLIAVRDASQGGAARCHDEVEVVVELSSPTPDAGDAQALESAAAALWGDALQLESLVRAAVSDPGSAHRGAGRPRAAAHA